MKLLTDEFLELLLDAPQDSQPSRGKKQEPTDDEVEREGERRERWRSGSCLIGGDEAEEASDGIFAEINITPLTDVFLVMVVIFMVTALAGGRADPQAAGGDPRRKSSRPRIEKKSGLRVNLPSGKAQDIDSSKASLILTIPVQGDIDIGGKTIPDTQIDQVFARGVRARQEHAGDPQGRQGRRARQGRQHHGAREERRA